MKAGCWYWFSCTECLYRCVRYRNSKECLHCHGKTLTRENEATEQEMKDEIKAAWIRYREIPE